MLTDVDPSGLRAAVESIRGELAGLVAKGRLTEGKARFLGSIVRAGDGLDAYAGCDLVLEAVFEELGVKREVFAGARGRRRARVPARDEHVVALGDGDGRGPPPSRAGRRAPLLQPRRGAAARRGRAHPGDRRRDPRDRLGRDPQARQARRARRGRAGVRREPHADAPVDRAHAGARERLPPSRRPTRPHSGSGSRCRRRRCSRWSGRASRTTCSRRSMPPSPTASRSRRRCRRSPTASSRRSSRATTGQRREIHERILEALADEARHILEEGVVADGGRDRRAA